eukprot:CAMPEP_0117445364 /NCGR_PEP_ID=MMETSP0759-20121206/5754_1 /TAXON_ID=63605 /ORGANISM="Percolomonas cosmopolitus, Strain WS" /LENGTH=916 /DNA_ID=CAMNT_0005237531 /DNA_START=483 /DNA_END=3233 /DNA_ORIENTATION=+
MTSNFNVQALQHGSVMSSSDRKRKTLLSASGSRKNTNQQVNRFNLEFEGMGLVENSQREPSGEDGARSGPNGSTEGSLPNRGVANGKRGPRKFSVDHGRRGALESSTMPRPEHHSANRMMVEVGSPSGVHSPTADSSLPHSARATNSTSNSPHYHIYALSVDDMLPAQSHLPSPNALSPSDDTISLGSRPIYNSNAGSLLPGRIFPHHPGSAPIGSRKRKNSLQLAHQVRTPKPLTPTSGLSLKEFADRQNRIFPQKTITTWHELREHLRQCRVEEDLLTEIESLMDKSRREQQPEECQTKVDIDSAIIKAAAPITQGDSLTLKKAASESCTSKSAQNKASSAKMATLPSPNKRREEKILNSRILEELLLKMNTNRNKKRPTTKINTERKRKSPPSLSLKKLSVQPDEELHEWKSSPVGNKDVSFSPVHRSSPPTKKIVESDSDSDSDSSSSSSSVSSNALRLQQRRTKREITDSPTSVNSVLAEMQELLETIYFPLLNGAEHDRSALTDFIAKVNKLAPSIRKRMRFELDVQRKAELEAHELEAKLLQSNYRLEKANEQIKSLKSELKRQQPGNGKVSKRKQSVTPTSTPKSRGGPLGDFHSKKVQISSLEENIREYSQKLLEYKKQFLELTDGGAALKASSANMEQEHLELNEKLVRSQIRMKEEVDEKNNELERLKKDIEHMHEEREDLLRRHKADRSVYVNQHVIYNQDNMTPYRMPNRSRSPTADSATRASTAAHGFRKDKLNDPGGLRGSLSPLGVSPSLNGKRARNSGDAREHVYRSDSPTQYLPMSRSPSPPDVFHGSGAPKFSHISKVRKKHVKAGRPNTSDAIHRITKGGFRMPAVKQLTPFKFSADQPIQDAPLHANSFPSKSLRKKQNTKRTSHIGTLLELSEAADRRDPIQSDDDLADNEWRM